jgi:hypothetical protein
MVGDVEFSLLQVSILSGSVILTNTPPTHPTSHSSRLSIVPKTYTLSALVRSLVRILPAPSTEPTTPPRLPDRLSQRTDHPQSLPPSFLPRNHQTPNPTSPLRKLAESTSHTSSQTTQLLAPRQPIHLFFFHPPNPPTAFRL